MPAMSPTMDKGGIIDWKFKVGEEFNAGDVILEVETDKAHIDVEAQDDGKFASITREAGSKDVNVGETIAYIAEIEDDISNFKPQVSKAESVSEKQEVKEQKVINSDNIIKDSSSSTILLPSVQVLLHQNGMSNNDALSQIKGTGKDGKILKGDIMEHLGQIPKESAKRIADYIAKFEKLPLPKMNEMATEEENKTGFSSEKVIPTEEKSTEPVEENVPQPKKKIEIEPPTSFEQIVCLTFPETHNYDKLDISIAKCLTKLYERSHKTHLVDTSSKLYDPIFEDLLVTDPHKVRFNYTYQLKKIDETGKKFDLSIDILRFNQYADSNSRTEYFIKQLAKIQELL